VIFDTPGSRDTNSGVTAFQDLHPGGQAETHFSLAADPNSLNFVFMGGDTMNVTGTDSPVRNLEFDGRLFQVDTSINFVATMTGNRATDPARGQQITAQNALLLGPAAGMTPTAGGANTGNVTDGNYQWVVTFVDGNGVESNPSAAAPLNVMG